MEPFLTDPDPPAGGDELPPPPSRPQRPPPIVPGYDVLEEIGRGGMGVVYRARHRRLGRAVALKLLRAGALAGPRERERFLREARAGAALQHPNIVQVHDVGEHAGCPYLALELVEGDSLARRLAAGPLPPRAAAALVEALARAVQYAHAQGVVHRDLKPANVLLASEKPQLAGPVPSGPGDSHPPLADLIPKVADFGLAQLLADDSNSTDTGTVLGTPSYMAPEQAGGVAAGPAADVYALGVILYECLTGRPPFRAAAPLETLQQVLTAEPVAPARLQPATPRDLDTVCLACLQKEPRRRYASADALADDLRRFLGGRPVLARPVGPLGRAARWCRRNPRVAGLLLALALALAGGFAGVFGQWRRAERLYGEADAQRAAAEDNLHRYQQAAHDFAHLLDLLDTDQLFHLRITPLRPELLLPALERNRAFLARHGADPERRADVVRAHFCTALLSRLLSGRGDGDARVAAHAAALDASRRALEELKAFASDHPDVVQYRRDCAALTHNLGYLLHAHGRSAEALPVLEAARQQRQELLDAQPDHLDYRSELAGCWNDIGLALFTLRRYDEALAALERAAGLQDAVVAAAPQVPRYLRLMGNHHFNRAMVLCERGQPAEALAAVAECRRLLPHDPEQYYQTARVLAVLAGRPGGEAYAADALAALRQALHLGFDDLLRLKSPMTFLSLHPYTEFRALLDEAERKTASGVRQGP